MAPYRIPDAALTQHVAVIGKTGSGKTSTEKLIVEQVVAEEFRVCILDAIKSDWWGITSSASGKKPGLPFRILGGPRGHVPLHSSAGAAIGELVGSGKLPLSIIDMADFEPGGLQRFFIAFADALMRHARGVVYLVIEEAHEFAPKERSGIGSETMAIHWAKKLATAGRSKGIRLVVATQRVQALHNAVLGSCETLIAHRLTAPADQEPVLKWVKANADKKVFDEVAASLSSLPTGAAWICSGEAQIFERAQLPKFITYDNTATPLRDGEEVDVRTAPVDRDALSAIIGESLREAEANDPTHLKAQVKGLSAEIATLKAGGASATAPPDPDALNRERQTGLAEGLQRGMRVGVALGITNAQLALNALQVDEIIARAEGDPAKTVRAIAIAKLPENESAATRAPTSEDQADTATPDGPKVLTKSQLNVLRALRYWKALGIPEPERPQIAVVAGWSPGGSNLRDRLSELARLGMVEYPKPGFVRLTKEGGVAAPAGVKFDRLIDALRSILTNPQQTVLDALIKAGRAVDRPFLAEAVGWAATGSNLRDRLGELSRLQIVEYPKPGFVRLTPWAADMAGRS